MAQLRSTGVHRLPEPALGDHGEVLSHSTVVEFGPRRVGIFESPGVSSTTLRVVDPEKPGAVLASVAIPHEDEYPLGALLAAPLGRGRCLVLFASFIAVASYVGTSVTLGPRLFLDVIPGVDGATVEQVQNMFLYALDETRARLLIEEEVIIYDESGALPPIVTYRRDTCVLTTAPDGQVTRGNWTRHAVPMRRTGLVGSPNRTVPLLVRDGSLYSFDGHIRRHDAEDPTSTLATSDYRLESIGGNFASAPNFSPEGTLQVVEEWQTAS